MFRIYNVTRHWQILRLSLTKKFDPMDNLVSTNQSFLWEFLGKDFWLSAVWSYSLFAWLIEYHVITKSLYLVSQKFSAVWIVEFLVSIGWCKIVQGANSVRGKMSHWQIHWFHHYCASMKENEFVKWIKIISFTNLQPRTLHSFQNAKVRWPFLPSSDALYSTIT